MHPALRSLRRIARALWDIRNPPGWAGEDKDRRERRQYTQGIADRLAARKAKAAHAWAMREQGLTYREIGRRMGGLCAQSARGWVQRHKYLNRHYLLE